MITFNAKVNDLFNNIIDKKQINCISTIDNKLEQCIYFLNSDLTSELVNGIKDNESSFFIIKNTETNKSYNKIKNIFLVDNTRYEMALCLDKISRIGYENSFIKMDKAIGVNEVYDNTFIHKSVIIERNVVIEPFCYIGSNVIIHEGSIIKTGAKIIQNTIIGKDCYIGSNSVIGGPGFGIEKDYNNNNYRIPHLAGVYIHDNVEVGSFTTICSGVLSPTEIKNYVKIDDHVHIAHNVNIDKNSLIVAGAVVGGSCKIEENVWVGINAGIHQKLIVKNNSIIGMGAVVLKNVEQNQTVIGNPAKELKKE